MVHVESDGRLVFVVNAPDASTVELVGAFDGWHEQRVAMEPSGDGHWRAEIDAGSGEHLFRYLIDGRLWVIDRSAHGSRVCVSGTIKSRVWCPPLDSLAA